MSKRFDIAAAAFIAVYTAGFLVVNVGAGDTQILVFQVLRGRYVAAGVLYIFYLLFPIGTAAILVDRLQDHSTRDKRSIQASALLKHPLIVVETLVVGWTLFSMFAALGTVALSAAYLRAAATFFGLSLFIGLLFADGVWGIAKAADTPQDGNAPQTSQEPAARVLPTLRVIGVSAFLLGSLVVMLVSLAATFGEIMFPYIHPKYGGGAAWAGSAVIATSAATSNAAEPVVFVDVQGSPVQLLRCIGSKLVLSTIPNSALGATRVDSLVVLEKGVMRVVPNKLCPVANTTSSRRR